MAFLVMVEMMIVKSIIEMIFISNQKQGFCFKSLSLYVVFKMIQVKWNRAFYILDLKTVCKPPLFG